MSDGVAQWLSGLAFVMLGAVLQGATGFGFAVVSVPLLAIVYGPHTAVVIGLCGSVVAGGMMTAAVRDAVDVAALRRWLLWALAGMPLGAAIYRSADPRALRLLIAVTVGALAVALLAGVRLRTRHERAAEALAAVAGGILATATGMPGPPLALYVAAAGFAKARSRATMTAFGLASSLFGLAVLALGRAVEAAQVVRSAGLALGVVGGLLLGFVLYRHISQRQFERAVLLTLVALAAGSGWASW